MGVNIKKMQAQLNALSEHLAQIQEKLLDTWRASAEGDDGLASYLHLSRTEFINHIPRILVAFCIRLNSWPKDDTPKQRQLELDAVKSHSHHRWQMGYNMQALTRDWGHLNICLLLELDDYGRSHPELQEFVLPKARQIWVKIFNDSISQSALEYHDLLQIEAVARLNHLETLLVHMHEMELMRGKVLRTATHDLRGSLGMLMGTADLIGKEEISQEDRGQLSHILNRGVSTLHEMLEELMDMARLESAQDPRCIAPFDAGKVFTELCAISQPIAVEKGLFIKTDGPASFLVEGDLVKTRRIAQNLLLNALKYTDRGGVTITWKAFEGKKYLLCVQDSGPGLENDIPDVLGHTHGEGVGLSIVKRLCELLNAKLEVESKAGVGTKFKILFPIQYGAGSK
ncbi:MAG TPA: hypothetical protein DET40_21035 [Lentisphaeria bacterium]|nr:MAG: hypothetical protein A2X45_15655 [Lentisphaerae bacterium GWF2_50_93]HCE46038.1 hypothetical protein [Lentisphaeria bacterium]